MSRHAILSSFHSAYKAGKLNHFINYAGQISAEAIIASRAGYDNALDLCGGLSEHLSTTAEVAGAVSTFGPASLTSLASVVAKGASALSSVGTTTGHVVAAYDSVMKGNPIMYTLVSRACAEGSDVVEHILTFTKAVRDGDIATSITAATEGASIAMSIASMPEAMLTAGMAAGVGAALGSVVLYNQSRHHYAIANGALISAESFSRSSVVIPVAAKKALEVSAPVSAPAPVSAAAAASVSTETASAVAPSLEPRKALSDLALGAKVPSSYKQADAFRMRFESKKIGSAGATGIASAALASAPSTGVAAMMR